MTAKTFFRVAREEAKSMARLVTRGQLTAAQARREIGFTAREAKMALARSYGFGHEAQMHFAFRRVVLEEFLAMLEGRRPPRRRIIRFRPPNPRLAERAKKLDFARRMRARLDQLGLSHSQLARAVGCTKGYISYLASGKKLASWERIASIAAALELEVTPCQTPRCARIAAAPAGSSLSNVTSA